jgi:flavin reductase (DIM6/NTAB) family NADH-FMN oxidoreductase RutF
MRDGDKLHGITVNAFMSVSLVPPLVAICIDKRANAHQTLLESERYGVSVLQLEQEHLSNHFAGRPTGETESNPFTEENGFPLIRGALANLICRISAMHEAGDHTIFIGQVEYLDYAEGTPLLYFQGQYAHVKELDLTK